MKMKRKFELIPEKFKAYIILTQLHLDVGKIK